MSNVVQLHSIGKQSATLREGEKLPLRYRARRVIAVLMHRFGCPGFVRPMEIHDPVTRDTFTVRQNATYTVITLNGRDYYFDRVSGEFDGTGYTPCR